MSNLLKAIVEIEAKGADKAAKDVVTSVNKIEGAINNLEGRVKAFGGSVTRFNSAFNPAVFNRIPPAVDKATAAIRKMPPSVNHASQSMLNFGRVIQDAPFGILGVANNINPLLESFQRLSASAKNDGISPMQALKKALIGGGGVGLAVSAVSSLLIVFGDKLFGTKKNADAAEASLQAYKAAIDGVSESVKRFKEGTSLALELGKINNSILGIGNLTNLQEESVKQDDILFDLREKWEGLGKAISKIEGPDPVRVRSFLQELDKISKDVKLGEGISGRDFDQITAEEEFSSKERIQIAKDLEKQMNEVGNKMIEEENRQRVIFRQIALQKVDDQKEADQKLLELRKKEAARYKQFVADTISRAKEIESATKGIINIKTGFSFLDTTEEEFRKALKFLNKFDKDQFKFILPVQVEFSEIEPRITSNVFGSLTEVQKLGAILGKEFTDGMASAIETGTIIAPTMAEQLEKQFAKQFESFGLKFAVTAKIDFSKSLEQNVKLLTAQLSRINTKMAATRTIAEGVSSAFSSMFDSLLDGQNALQALGNAFKQLALDIIQAALKALIFKAITGLLNPAGATVGKIGGIAGSIFGAFGTNSTGGNGDIGGLGLGGQSSRVEFRIRGNDLVGALASTSRSQNRLG